MPHPPPPACELELPYPPVAVERPDPAFAALLAADYAGKRSALTAALQYAYQHTVLKKKHPALSETMACIALAEMRHVDLLGEAILLLGDKPRYVASARCRQQPWCGGFPDYSTERAAILRANICAETDAIERCRARIQQTCDPYVRALLRRIQLDEQRHLEVFLWYRDRDQA